MGRAAFIPLGQRLRRLVLIGLLSGSTAACSAAAPTPTPSNTNRSDDASSVLFNTLIPRIEITLEPESLQALRVAPREYVRATLREGTNVLAGVGIKLKGARGSYRPVDDRPALTINIDKFVPGLVFHGLDKFHLNNSVQDPTLMNELIGSAVFLEAGVPTARATHARVWFDGRDLGYYVLKEGYDKRFLKRHFAQSNGNLYDGGFLSDIDENLEKDSGDGPNDWSDLVTLFNAASEPDLERRQQRLAGVLDLDRFLTLAALEMLMCHWDGYVQNRNNYRLYHDPATRKFVFIPHGMDQLFREAHYPILPMAQPVYRGRRGFRRSGLVSDRMFEVSAYREQYLDRMGELLTTVFTEEKLGQHVDRIEKRVQAQLGRSDPQFVSWISTYARHLRRHLADRVRVARSQHTVYARTHRGGER